MKSLLSKILFSCFILMLSVQVSEAQKGSSKNYNYLDYKYKPYYFGLSIGGSNSSFVINHSKRFILNDSIGSSVPIANKGLSMQGIFNLKLGDYFDFRVLAGFTLSQRSLAFYRPNQNKPFDQERIEFVYADIPFLIRYKSAPYRDKRAFVVAGVKYTYDVNGFSRSRGAEDLVTVVPHDFSLEVGAGMQFFFPFFIMSPEVKFSQGIGNILSYNNNLNKSKVIDALLSRTFSISVHFEG